MYGTVHHPGGIVPTSPVALVVARARSSNISHTHAACSHYLRRYNIHIYINIAFDIIYDIIMYTTLLYRYISIYNCDDDGLERLSDAILLFFVFFLMI